MTLKWISEAGSWSQIWRTGKMRERKKKKFRCLRSAMNIKRQKDAGLLMNMENGDINHRINHWIKLLILHNATCHGTELQLNHLWSESNQRRLNTCRHKKEKNHGTQSFSLPALSNQTEQCEDTRYFSISEFNLNTCLLSFFLIAKWGKSKVIEPKSHWWQYYELVMCGGRLWTLGWHYTNRHQ